MQQPALFSGEEKYKPHHHGKCSFVEGGVGNPFEHGTVGILIQCVEGLHQHLDRLAYLIAELVGDFLLILRAFLKQSEQSAVGGDAEETPHSEQRMKSTQSDRLVEPERAIPGGVAGGFAPRWEDQHPMFSVCNETVGHSAGVKQFLHVGGMV